jgi:hypothetical protein
MRVTFEPDEDQKLVFSIRNRVVDVVNDGKAPEESTLWWHLGGVILSEAKDPYVRRMFREERSLALTPDDTG